MTKDIDPLLEKVTAAIKAATKEEVYVHDVKFLHATMDGVRSAQARAAIAAVLEWYSKAENISSVMIAADNDGYDEYWGRHWTKYQTDTEFKTLQKKAVKVAYAAAMAAELKRRQI